VAAYFLAWIAAYAVIMAFDFSHVRQYFILAWTGGGELPSFIQLVAVLTSLVVACGAIMLSIFKWHKSKGTC